MDDIIGQSCSQDESSFGTATSALHVDDSSSGEDEPHHCSLASRLGDCKTLQHQLDDLIDKQCRSIQEELQLQIDTEIHNALQKQIDDALQKQIDNALQRQIDEELQTQIDEELQKQIDDALNEEFNRVLDLHNREVSLANQLDFESMASIYEDESIAKLLQEYFNSDGSQK